MGRTLAGIALALTLLGADAWSSSAMAGAPPHDCVTPLNTEYGTGVAPYPYTTVYTAPKYPKGYTNQPCGDATRGMLLYGHDPGPLGRAWQCDMCHSASPLTDKSGGMPQILLRGAPRDPGYIASKLPYAPGAGFTWVLMTQLTCGTGDPAVHCLEDSEPANVMGDLGDLAEFLHTCNVGIAPCVAGGGSSPGQLQGSPSVNFGSVAMASTSATQTLTLFNIGSTRVNVANVTTSDTSEFPILTNGCGPVDPYGSCDVVLAFRPSALGSRSAALTIISDGVGSPQVFGLSGTAVASFNYEGLWWVDKGAEDGWGVNIAHQGDSVFATWYTYDTSGNAWWLSMLATKVGGTTGTFTGPILLSHGSAFNATPFVPSSGAVDVGNGTKGTLTFSDGNHASFDYTVNGVHQTKSLVRYDLHTGPLPSCTAIAAPDYAGTSNYQNLWWALGGGESGWGINLIHQGDKIFATWYTYDTNGLPLWLSALLGKTGPGVYSGSLIRTSGPRFDSYVGPPTKSDAGTLTLTFANGNLGTMLYTVMSVAPGTPVTQAKQITRFIFGSPPTLCQ